MPPSSNFGASPPKDLLRGPNLFHTHFGRTRLAALARVSTQLEPPFFHMVGYRPLADVAVRVSGEPEVALLSTGWDSVTMTVSYGSRLGPWVSLVPGRSAAVRCRHGATGFRRVTARPGVASLSRGGGPLASPHRQP